jgi:hypothetical protein
LDKTKQLLFMKKLMFNPVPVCQSESDRWGHKKFKKMSRKRILVAMIALCVATAPIFGAEGMGESAYNYHSASQVNGDKNGVEFRALTDTVANKTCLQMQVPGYGEYLVEPAWVTRLLGKFIEAKADSTGRVLVSVVLDKYEQKLKREFITRDSFWLYGIAGQTVAWTEVNFERETEYRTVENYQLLTKADAKHYFPFNEEYTRPKFEAPEPTAQTTFGTPDFSKQQNDAASADNHQGFRIRGGKSKAERQLAKAQKAPKNGHSRVTNRRYIGG